jgi:hypothetical protein
MASNLSKDPDARRWPLGTALGICFFAPRSITLAICRYFFLSLLISLRIGGEAWIDEVRACAFERIACQTRPLPCPRTPTVNMAVCLGRRRHRRRGRKGS